MRKKFIVFLSVLLAIGILYRPIYAQTFQDVPMEKIVLVVDLSGSVAQFDTKNDLQEAFLLAIGLAPDQAQVAVIGMNDKIVVDTDFYDTTDIQSRSKLMETVQSLTYKGNTNLVVGLQRAVEKLNGSGRIIFFGDISEGGLMPATESALIEWTDQANKISEECQKTGITIDLILTGQTPEANGLAKAIEQIAADSGGRTLRTENAAEVSGYISDILFSNYPYFMVTRTSVNSSEELQKMNITMPSEHIRRVRVFVPSSVGIQASYAGAGLETQRQSTYSLLDLSTPARDGLSLSIAKTDTPVPIYLIADYRLKGKAKVNSELIVPQNKDEAYRQKTTVSIDVLDESSGQSILDADTAKLFSAALTLTAPDGSTQAVQGTVTANGLYQASFEPLYGTYQVMAVLSSGEYALPAVSSAFEVVDIRPVEESWPLAIKIASGVSSLLLLLALLFFILYKRKKATYEGAVEMSSDYHFHGKLSVYAVLLEGGNREIRPFDFRLHTLPDKRITLRNILDSIGEKDSYEGSENILFLVGPEESIILRNNSRAMIRVMGRSYDYRSTTQLFYDQKCYIVFEKDVSELEIKYCRVKVEDPAPMQFSIQSRRGHS